MDIQAAKQAWYACPHQTCLIQLSKRTKHHPSNTRNVLRCLIECLMAFKFDQTRSNCAKQGGQMVKCLFTKQCLMVFGRQTVAVWTGLKVARNSFHSLSLDATIMVPKNCPVIGEHFVIIVVSHYVTIATVRPAKNTLNYRFRGL